MRGVALSGLGLRAERFLQEHHTPAANGEEPRWYWRATTCHAARNRSAPHLWESLVYEERRETLICDILEGACVLSVILAFLWPYIR